MKKNKHERNNVYKKKDVDRNEKQGLMFEIDEFYFEKENHRKKRETTKRKKQERERKEDKWN